MVKRCEWWGYLHHILAYFFWQNEIWKDFYDGVMMNIRKSCHLWGLTPSWILNIFGTWGPIRLIIMIGKSMILKDIRGFLPIILRYLRQIVKMRMPWNWPCLYEQYICCIGQQENFQNHIFNEAVTPIMWNTRGRKHRETFITIFSNRQFNLRNFPQLSFPPFFPNSHASPKTSGFSFGFLRRGLRWMKSTHNLWRSFNAYFKNTKAWPSLGRKIGRMCFHYGQKNRPHGFSSGFLFANFFLSWRCKECVISFHFLLGMMGFGHIFIYCTSFRYIFLQVFQQAFHQVCPETWRIDSEWNSRRSLDPDFLGRKSVDHFFFGESFPSTFEEFAGSFCFVFGSSGGCKSETLEETSGKIFLELPNLSWSNLPPSQVALVPVKVWWVPHPIFFGLVVFFFKATKALALWDFFFSRSALPCRPVWEPARCCPWLWKQAALLRGWGSSSFKDSRLNDHLWKTGCFPPKVRGCQLETMNCGHPFFQRKAFGSVTKGMKATGEKIVDSLKWRKTPFLFTFSLLPKER